MHNQPSAAIARYTQKATLSRKAPLLEKLGTEIDEMSIETAICPSDLARVSELVFTRCLARFRFLSACAGVVVEP